MTPKFSTIAIGLIAFAIPIAGAIWIASGDLAMFATYSWVPIDVLVLLAAALGATTARLIARWTKRARLFGMSPRSIVVIGIWTACNLLGVAASSHWRPWLRWQAAAHELKPGILASPAKGGLRYGELDGWGWAGSGETRVYAVFDPGDALASPSRGEYGVTAPGLPCEVWSIQRLEPHWYAVRFFTMMTKDECNL